MRERLKALDGLRAISVAGVFFTGYHWMLPFGWIGVLVFYVLSGYLITHILLGEREHARSEASAAAAPSWKNNFFARFYYRRTLRIFPLYFAYLLVLELSYWLASAPPDWPQVRPYAFLYAINVGMMTGVVLTREAYGHLWTLSVEEQFYIVWPLVVWLVSRTALTRIAAAIFLLGPLTRYASVLVGLNLDKVYVSSFSHLDAFAIGALLACVGEARLAERRVLPLALGAAGIALLLGAFVLKTEGLALRTLGYPEGLKHGWAWIWGYSVLNTVSALFVWAALRGELPRLGTPWLAYLGKISYGIYLVQRPIKGVYMELFEPRVLAVLPSQKLGLAVGAALCIAVSIAIAALSYRFFELPLLRFRDARVPPLRPAP
jgi:peptidoglycan/LPS O-acetylase OafA/YrhL